MTAPPAQPRRRRWIPPSIGDRYVRDIDGTLFIVRQIYRRDQQVLLVNEDGSHKFYVFARDLERDWQAIS